MKARITDPGRGQQETQCLPQTGRWLYIHILHHLLNPEEEQIQKKVTGDTSSQPSTIRPTFRTKVDHLSQPDHDTDKETES